MNLRTALLIASAGMLASSAVASVIAISDIGGGVVLNSGPLGNDTFSNEQSNWSATSLAGVHEAINTTGVNTNGKITIFAADTAQGLSLMALIDQEFVHGDALLGHVHMDSVANGTNLAYVKDSARNIVVTPNGANSRIASGNFTWNSNGAGDGFAWAGLQPGNATTFRFNRVANELLGLSDPATFQFLNWNGTKWEIIAIPDSLVSFTQSNDFGFSASVVVPAPSTLLAAAGPIALAFLRRRRSL